MTQQDRRFKVARQHQTIMKLNEGYFMARCDALSEWFTQFDMFGYPVSLTYKGSPTFRTSWGACVTILAVLAFIWALIGIAHQTYFQPVKKYITYRDLVNPSLSDPDLSAESSLESFKAANATGLNRLTLNDPGSLFRILNLDTLSSEIGRVELYRTTQDELKGEDILTVCEGTPSKASESIATATYQCLSPENEYTLFDSQLPFMYDTSDYWETSEQVSLRIRPCVFDGENVCGNVTDILEYFDNHNFKLNIRQLDDLGNSYWYQEPLPQPGQAITLFVREIQTVNEDYYFMTG